MQDVPLDLSCSINIDFYCLKYKKCLWVLVVEPSAKRRKETTLQPPPQPIGDGSELKSIEMTNNDLPFDSVMTNDPGSTQFVRTDNARGDILPLSAQQTQNLHQSDLYRPIAVASGCTGEFADIFAWNIIHKLCGAGIGNLATLKRFVDLLFIYLNIL
jgi:hypothetical protein